MDDHQFEAQLAVWQKQYEQVLHSDRATVDLGIFALKVAITVNAGGLLALLAAVKHLEGAPGAIAFFVGLATAGIATLLSYIYQGFLTKRLSNQFRSSFSSKGELPPHPWSGRLMGSLLWIVVALVTVSYFAFGRGTWAVIDSIS